MAGKALKLCWILVVYEVLFSNNQQGEACLLQEGLCVYSVRQQDQGLDDHTLSDIENKNNFICSFKNMMHLIYPKYHPENG